MEKLVGYAVRRTDNGKYYAGYGIKDGAVSIHWETRPDKPRTLDGANNAADIAERIARTRCPLEVISIYQLGNSPEIINGRIEL